MKKIESKSFKKIDIPHLYAEVHLFDLKDLFGAPFKTGMCTQILGEDKDKIFIGIFIEGGIESINAENAPHFAHEFTHVIQILCEKRIMKIEEEKEHTAYLMYYFMKETYEIRKGKNR